MTLNKKRLIDISVALAIISCIMISMCGFVDSCRDMYDNIIRIRVIANSDSDLDQSLKLAVRDSILESTKTVFGETMSYDDALCAANENIDFLTELAKKTVNDLGFDYDVETEIRDEKFDTREYEDFTLPAGTYKTLVVTIGQGKGRNWWCVMYPKVCVGACSGELTDTIKESSANYAENSEKYVLKFKVVEIFEKIKEKL